MKAAQLIHKAALLMDLKGDVEKASAALRSAIEAADAAAEVCAGIEARVFLADVLVTTGQSATVRALLDEALRLADQVTERDLVDTFVERAHELLAMSCERAEFGFSSPHDCDSRRR